MLRAGCIWTALINAFFLDFLAVITNILQTSELIYEISKKNYQQHGPKGVRIRSGDAKIESGTFPASDYVTYRSYTDQWHRVIVCLHFTGRTNHHGRTCATCLRSVTGREDHIFETRRKEQLFTSDVTTCAMRVYSCTRLQKAYA